MTLEEKIARLRDRKIVALTAYDYPTARLVDESGIDLILVGDSLGMVVAGHPDTTSVTMEQMLYHTEIVGRGVSNALLVADLPYHSYETVRGAVINAKRLIEAGADAVKLEGARGVMNQVEAVIAERITLVGHVGMLPQNVRKEGGYKKKGKTDDEAARLLEDALGLEQAGAVAIVLESIVPAVATRITEALTIPTIGIGAGSGCRGQIAVISDVIGSFPWFLPPFAQPMADVAGTIQSAVRAYAEDVRAQDPAQNR